MPKVAPLPDSPRGIRTKNTPEPELSNIPYKNFSLKSRTPLACAALAFFLTSPCCSCGAEATALPPEQHPAAQAAEESAPESAAHSDTAQDATPAHAGKADGAGTQEKPAAAAAEKTGPSDANASGSTEKQESKAAADAEKKSGSEDKSEKAEPAVCWLPLRALVTSPFGAARGTTVDDDGVSHVDHYHSGVDLRAHLGWPIRSLRNGTCVQAGPRGSAGIAVEIRQDNGKTAVYCHLGRALVQPGETVSKGQHIGVVGCTGRTTGAHLHLTMRDAGGKLINPMREVSEASELFDPPSSEMSSTVQGQSCDGHRFAAALPYGDRNTAAKNGLYRGPNKRLRGMQQYLRMRKALKGISDYKIPDIVTWEGMQK